MSFEELWEQIWGYKNLPNEATHDGINIDKHTNGKTEGKKETRKSNVRLFK